MQHSQQGSEGMRLHALPIGQWATVRRVLNMTALAAAANAGSA